MILFLESVEMFVDGSSHKGVHITPVVMVVYVIEVKIYLINNRFC